MLFDGNEIVYVGETGKISGRMRDMCDTRHHTVRRSIGSSLFPHVEGYEKASSKKKHPDHIEAMITKKMLGLEICAFPVKFGRKELEEYILEKYDPKFNNKKKRG